MSINARNVFATFLATLVLKGGLKQVIFRFLILFISLFLSVYVLTTRPDDAMKPKFSFVEITPISEVSSISVIKWDNRLPRTCRHKLSTSFAMMVGNDATVLQTNFDDLLFISAVAIIFRLLLSVYIFCGYARYQFSGTQGFDWIR